MAQLSATEQVDETSVVRLSRTSRWVRLAIAGVLLALTVAGAIWGDDSEFPFGPERMYSTRNDPNSPVVSTRVVGLTAAGEEVRLSGGQVGLRRAEFEGQFTRVREHPELLALLAGAYADRHPDAPPLVDVEVVHREFQLVHGKSTGEYTDTVVVDYDLTGAHQGGTP